MGLILGQGSVIPQTTWHSMCVLSRVELFETPWTVACQAPLSVGFSRQEYRIGLPFPPPGHLPDPSIEPTSLCVSYTGSRFFPTGATWEAPRQGAG